MNNHSAQSGSTARPKTTELMATLSLALDLASGQPLGHALRSTLIALRMADELGLDQKHKTGLYLGMLIKDAGCASSASEIFRFFGSDEIAAQRISRTVDWNDKMEVAKYAAGFDAGGSIISKARSVMQLTKHHAVAGRMLTKARSDAASHIIRKLRLGPAAEECVCAIDERWDGTGGPNGLSEYGIPLMARIAAVAQALDALTAAYSRDTAFELLIKRCGTMYEPETVKVALSLRECDRFWERVEKRPRASLLEANLAVNRVVASAADVTAICQAYAAVVDAKSRYTHEHSIRVRQYSIDIGQALGLSSEALETLNYAALLHDVGMLSVPNSILEKPAQLTEDEWTRVKKSPAHTHGILKRIKGFERVTQLASSHNERLNGSGYFQGLSAETLDTEMRIIAVADVFDALSTDRPHRAAMPIKQIFTILDNAAGVSLDADCIEVIKSIYCFQTLADLKSERLSVLAAA